MSDWALRITGGAAPLELSGAQTRGVVTLRAEVALPSGLAAATVRLTVRGLADAVAGRMLAEPGPLVAELYLHGAAGAARPFDPAARVAAAVVDRAVRHQGRFGPELGLDGIDEAYHRLSAAARTPVPAGDHRTQAAELGRRAGVAVQVHGEPVPSGPLPAGPSHLEHLAGLEQALAEHDGRGGRALALFRDGVLHLGARPAALVAVHDVRPRWSEESAGARAARPAVRLGLPGDARLLPGDLVRPGDGARPLYVTAVRHTLDGTHGFTTVIAAVAVTGPEDAWDGRPGAADRVTLRSEPAADPAAAAARAVA
ncbi:hypothetical protein, partial [Kitasatospora sp. NPDC059462]|uniref:hypothetical protein n=1 Tax=Kitasatospora sp. NPDC059462 TaxID=3346841 RepID=UPI0036C55352